MKTFTGTSYFTAILIVLLWIIPVTSVQAQLSRQQCVDIMEMDYPRYQFLVKKYGDSEKSDKRIGYATSKARKELLEGECSHLPSADYNARLSKNSMEDYGIWCQRNGMGSNCNVTSLDDFFSGFSMQGVSSSNQDQPTAENNSNQASNDSPPTKKLTAAERKKQQAQQQADDLGTQSQQLAQENQSKADAARQGKRKRHNQDYQASQCVKVDYNFGIFGALINTCNFKIHYTYCGYHPTESSWLSHMACENQKFGSGAISPLKRTTAHTKQVEGIYWLACKDPA